MGSAEASLVESRLLVDAVGGSWGLFVTGRAQSPCLGQTARESSSTKLPWFDFLREPADPATGACLRLGDILVELEIKLC